MRYLALLGSDESDVPAPGTPERDEMHAGYVRFAQLAADAILAGEALQPATTARTVRHGDGGEPLVTEGPYAETAEALGGFYVLEADTLDDAIALAREIPTARHGWVAVRPLVMWQSDPGERRPGTPHLALMYGKESPATCPAPPSGTPGRPSTAASPRRPGRPSWPGARCTRSIRRPPCGCATASCS